MPKGLNKPLGDQFLDQLAHTAVMVFVMAFTLCVPPPYGGALAGVTVGLLAEYKEGGNMFSTGSLLDILIYALAGAGLQSALV